MGWTARYIAQQELAAMAALETAREEVEADSELVAARAACVDSLRQYVNHKLAASEFDEATIDEAMETLDKWYAVRGARIQPLRAACDAAYAAALDPQNSRDREEKLMSEASQLSERRKAMEEATRTPEAIGQLLKAVRAVGQGKQAILDSDIELSELRMEQCNADALTMTADEFCSRYA